MDKINKKLKVKRNGPDIIRGYIRLLNEIEQEIGGFSDDLEATDWSIVHQRGFNNFFIEGSKYHFKGLTIDDAREEMDRYINRKAKSGDSISLKGDEDYSNFPASPHSLKRLIVFESENTEPDQGKDVPVEKIEFILPDIRSPLNCTDLNNPTENMSVFGYLIKYGFKDTVRGLKDHYAKRCEIGVNYQKS